MTTEPVLVLPTLLAEYHRVPRVVDGNRVLRAEPVTGISGPWSIPDIATTLDAGDTAPIGIVTTLQVAVKAGLTFSGCAPGVAVVDNAKNPWKNVYSNLCSLRRTGAISESLFEEALQRPFGKADDRRAAR